MKSKVKSKTENNEDSWGSSEQVPYESTFVSESRTGAETEP